jgi:hypothetical protein
MDKRAVEDWKVQAPLSNASAAAIGSSKRLDLGGGGSGKHDILHRWAQKK